MESASLLDCGAAINGETVVKRGLTMTAYICIYLHQYVNIDPYADDWFLRLCCPQTAFKKRIKASMEVWECVCDCIIEGRNQNWIVASTENGLERYRRTCPTPIHKAHLGPWMFKSFKLLCEQCKQFDIFKNTYSTLWQINRYKYILIPYFSLSLHFPDIFLKRLSKREKLEPKSFACLIEIIYHPMYILQLRSKQNSKYNLLWSGP